MKHNARLIAYVLLVIGVIWFGWGFYRNYAQVSAPSGPAPATNQAAAGATDPPTASTADPAPAAPPAHTKSRMMTYGAGLFFMILGLGMLGAYDLSHYFAHRFEKFIFDDEGEAHRDPEYEEAEKVWANGNHLEAIQLMRDYLKERPREQYVAIRIAEIYENDLGNPLASALEYEEILKKPLPPERWGWVAVHLANVYSGKLNRVPDAEALLHRIIDQYPDTAAAKKARERLGEPEPASPAAGPDPSAGSGPSTPDRPHNLPPGFRPKT